MHQIQCLLCAKVTCASLTRDILGLRYSCQHNMANGVAIHDAIPSDNVWHLRYGVRTTNEEGSVTMVL